MKSSHRYYSFGAIALIAILSLGGCATPPQPLPQAYLTSESEIAIDVTKINEEGVFRSSGGGGLIGALVDIGREGDLREKMKGIKGAMVEKLVSQELTRNLEEHFYVEEESEELRMDVEVLTWGWFLPTAMFGIKAGDYATEIVANVFVYDLKKPEKEQRIGYVQLRATAPLGADPDEKQLQESLLQCADNFGKEVVDFLLSREKEAATPEMGRS